MKKINMIPAAEFCSYHNITVNFLDLLQEAGMIELASVENSVYIYENQLGDIEKMIRMYYEMDINIEGIETISRLLKRINDMQDEILLLKNRLRFYEEDL